MFANKANFNSIFLQCFLTHSFPQPEYQVFLRGVGERRFPLCVFIASLSSLPPETPENSGYFFTMRCSSLLPKWVGVRRFPLSLSLLSSPFPHKP